MIVCGPSFAACVGRDSKFASRPGLQTGLRLYNSLRERDIFKRTILLTTLTAVLAGAPASALDFQAKQWYGQGIVALPTGNFGDFANFGLGAGVGLFVPHTPEAQLSRRVFLYLLHDRRLFGIWGDGRRCSQSDPHHGSGAVPTWSVEFNSTTFGSASGSDSSTELGSILGAGTKLKPSLSLEGRLNFISDTNTISANLGWWSQPFT